MRVGALLLGVMVFTGFEVALPPAHADTPSVPTLVYFVMSPNSLDIASSNTTVTFDLVVSNPSGISSDQVLVTLSDGGSNSVVVPVIRTDFPVNSTLQTVEFKGAYKVASNLPTGVYKATATPVIGLTPTGSQGFSTQILSATTSSKVVGATNALLIRNGGYLNFSYPTFIGPTFNTLLANHFVDPKYNSIASPIWKVGETINVADFYELEVPSLVLLVKSTTPDICSSKGTSLSLIAVGNCGFSVYTDKTLDYQYKQDYEIVSVTTARVKPNFAIGTIPTQSSTVLPLNIQGPLVYGPIGFIYPVSATPSVCYAIGSYINVISGGPCILNYSSPDSTNYLASDLTPLTFEITRTPQLVSFAMPPTVILRSKTLVLNATSSSGLAVTFQSDSPVTCSVTGSSLNLLAEGSCRVEAIQAGSRTIAPNSVVQSLFVLSEGQKVKKPRARKSLCLKKGKVTSMTGNNCSAA